jgi:hypothetical protein
MFFHEADYTKRAGKDKCRDGEKSIKAANGLCSNSSTQRLSAAISMKMKKPANRGLGVVEVGRAI